MNQCLDRGLVLTRKPMNQCLDRGLVLTRKPMNQCLDRGLVLTRKPMNQCLDRGLVLTRKPMNQCLDRGLVLTRKPMNQCLDRGLVLTKKPMNQCLDRGLVLTRKPMNQCLDRGLVLTKKPMNQCLDRGLVLTRKPMNQCLDRGLVLTRKPMNQWLIRVQLKSSFLNYNVHHRWLTVTDYMCHKWLRTCSDCRNHNPVLSAHSWHIAGFVTSVARRLQLVEQEHHNLLEQTSSPRLVVEFVCSFFFLPFCLFFYSDHYIVWSFFDIRRLNTPLVSLNFSLVIPDITSYGILLNVRCSWVFRKKKLKRFIKHLILIKL